MGRVSRNDYVFASRHGRYVTPRMGRVSRNPGDRPGVPYSRRSRPAWGV